MVIAFRYELIAEHAMGDTLFKGFADGRSGLEVHVRHPHWNYIIVVGNVPFQTLRATTNYIFIEVEVICHFKKICL